MTLPLVAVPIGDPAGIGPEIVVKAMADQLLRKQVRVVLVGDERIVREALEITGLPMEIALLQDNEEVPNQPSLIPMIDLANLDPSSYHHGSISAAAGLASYEYIQRSIELANHKIVDAIATPPINKESLNLAGIPFIGHTEIFENLTNTPDPLTMFEVRGLRIFFLSRHVSLRKACDLITEDRIVDYVTRIMLAMQRMGVEDPSIAVAGLNPHCGENGLFGEEEVSQIEPAIKHLQSKGVNVVGPVSADSVFHQALTGRYSCVLSLYHDQGHIAAKTLDFERTISVTCGMPILRTSVDHGTAFDIAGKNIASPVSMIEAIRLAGKYAPFFSEHGH